jgi:hypothetical protein
MITVMHISEVDLNDANVVYIGRAMPMLRLRSSPWANPFKIGGIHPISKDLMTRHGAVFAHRLLVRAEGELLDTLLATAKNDAEFGRWLDLREHAREHIAELEGRTLACWCANREGAPAKLTADSPRPHICHGQTLAAMALA